MKKRKLDKFTIIGICFIGVSVVFMTTVDFTIGAAFLIFGVSYIAIGINRQESNK